MQEIEIWPYERMVYAQNFLGFWDANRSPNLGQTTRPSDSQQQQQQQQIRSCWIVDFVVPAGHSGKIKESEKRNKYLELNRELKKNYGTWRWRWYQL